MKSMTYTVVECEAYDNVLIIYFYTTTNFSRTYIRTYSNFSKPAFEKTTDRKLLINFFFISKAP